MPPVIDIGNAPDKFAEIRRTAQVTFQRYLDASVPHRGMRWSLFAMLCLLYLARVFGGSRPFHILTYGLFIHMLAQVLLLVTPLYDPEEHGRSGGSGDGALPTTNARSNRNDPDEFRPFVPVVQEFVVWKSVSKAVLLCLFLTIFPFLDIPVYWPILVLYSVVLFALNMGTRVLHMMRHGYVPWSTNKPKFVPKNNL